MNRLSEYSDTLTLPSGRILAWKLYGGTLQGKGTEKSDIVFYFHGYPGCFVEATLISVELLKKSNIRCIAPDRPGMNMTTHYDERRILDWPTDVLAIADHLSVSRFFVLGVSGGGPYALACAYSVSRDRLQGVAVVSGMYPTTFSTEGMLPELKVLLAAGAAKNCDQCNIRFVYGSRGKKQGRRKSWKRQLTKRWRGGQRQNVWHGKMRELD